MNPSMSPRFQASTCVCNKFLICCSSFDCAWLIDAETNKIAVNNNFNLIHAFLGSNKYTVMLLYYGRAIAYEGDQNPVNPHSQLALMSTFAAIPLVMSKRMIFYIVFFAVLVIGFFGFISYSIPGFM